ncbi:unnamed protein product, partial [Hapterophycus canaliculatus]
NAQPCLQISQSREVKWTDVDGVAILAAHKGVPVKATIEHMRDGSSFRCARKDPAAMFLGLFGGRVWCPAFFRATLKTAPIQRHVGSNTPRRCTLHAVLSSGQRSPT